MNFFATSTGYTVNVSAIEYIERSDDNHRAHHLHMRGGERITVRPEDVDELLQQVVMPNTDPTACVLMVDHHDAPVVVRRMPVIFWRRHRLHWLPVTAYDNVFVGIDVALSQAGVVTPLCSNGLGVLVGYSDGWFASEDAWLAEVNVANEF